MKSIIEEFYYGKVIPFEQKTIKSDEYNEILKEILKTEEVLSSRFPEADELTTKYRKLQINLQNINKGEYTIMADFGDYSKTVNINITGSGEYDITF